MTTASGLEVVEFTSDGRTFYLRRDAYDGWKKAGSPRITDGGALRTEASQQEAWDRYQAGEGSPADDPSRPQLFQLGHVRGVALDLASANNAAMESGGFYRPFGYEPWHWALRNLYDYPLVKEADMPLTREDKVWIRAAIKSELKAERPATVDAIFSEGFKEVTPEAGAPIPAETFKEKIARIRLGVRNNGERLKKG